MTALMIILDDLISGAFQMTGLEMATAVFLKLPVICVILRDGNLARC